MWICQTKRRTAISLAIASVLSQSSVFAEDTAQLDELVVEAGQAQTETTHYTSPSVVITKLEAEAINTSTVEDFVKYQPGMVVRRRYIGDSNGVVGIRGSNMFQTARTLVYADGMPLHSLLETRWNGAPRWSLVAGGEVESMEVIYGPFSAEYSGNAIGGVININTDMPKEREFHVEGGVFSQDFSHMKVDDTYSGHREFVSYGDRIDALSVYLFHNHLENESQPQIFRAGTILAPGAGTVVTNGVTGLDSIGRNVVYYGDSGADDVATDLTKFKLGYDFGDWQGRLTLAYENLDKQTNPQTWVVDGTGNRIWSGNAVFNGDRFSIGSWAGNPFAVSDQTRRTLLVAADLEGHIGNGWQMNANISHFDVLEDETLSSDRNPLDPAWSTNGSVSEYEDTGWVTLDLKARHDNFLGRDDMSFVAGYHYDHYSLEVHSYDSTNYLAGLKNTATSSSGGDTRTHALFAQWGWDFRPNWDIALGGRYERWESLDGFNHSYPTLRNFADRSKDAFSPKFSLGFTPDNPWQARYSLAKAYRFPLVEELFKNETAITGSTIANEHLEPEVGIHHNLMLERDIPRGFVRVNLFHEVVEDAIWNQTDVTAVPTVTTFLPVSEVTTSGIELMLQQSSVFDSDVDVNLNVAYTDSEVTENAADPSMVGNEFPRIPRWRANMLTTWHATSRLDTSLGIRYASDTYGNLDNNDNVDEVYGAQDAYLFLDIKGSYSINDQAKVSFGVDNVTDEVAFVAHPWPQRTYYLQGSVDF